MASRTDPRVNKQCVNGVIAGLFKKLRIIQQRRLTERDLAEDTYKSVRGTSHVDIQTLVGPR